MMKTTERKLPVGIESFQEIRTEGFYYVDKTAFIRDLLESWGKVNLFTRPRRFGKTLNLDMLKSFFEIGADPSLFDGLNISEEKELCRQYMGQFPVIFLSLKSVVGNDFGSALKKMSILIRKEARRFQFLLESDRLSDIDKEALRPFYQQRLGRETQQESVMVLSEMLFKHYGKKVIILFDEYDVPLEKAYQNGYYEEMADHIRSMFEMALKTNEFLHFAVVSGCLRVSKESIFTGLNNFKVHTLSDVAYDEYFGFTDREVRKLLQDYGLEEKYEQVTEWYDGYRFGQERIYCPWDVLNYVSDRLADPDGERLFLAANGKLRPAAQAVEELETLCRKPGVFSKNPENVCESSQAPVGSPGVLCESPEAFMGSPGVLCESPEAFMGSPGVPCESPEASVGSSGDACERAQSVTGSSENTCGGEEAIFAVESNFEKEAYKQAVREMIRYITEGDIYIANMTRHLKIKSPKKPWEVFEELRQNNPSPFGGYLNYGDFQVVCASPERFLKMRNGHISTRPIKGTRKRGADPKEDLAMRLELENSEKDKSELLMIVDLERNDLNRVCVPGSVRVTELFTVEEYATVFHLVANVEGDLAPGNTVMDLVEAAFPGGSITGAPKLRAMEIIDELEHGRRNLYTGSIGYLTLDGCCDFNIVIRTALHCRDAWYLGVGGGITWESELEFEYEETRQKAAAILNALAPKGDGRHEDLDG